MIYLESKKKEHRRKKFSGKVWPGLEKINTDKSSEMEANRTKRASEREREKIAVNKQTKQNEIIE